MKKKFLAIVLLCTMALSVTACGKEEVTTGLDVPETSEVVSEEAEEVKEVSLLEGQSYTVSLNMQSGASVDTTVNYTKAVSGQEYSYTLNYANTLLGQSQAYCNGTDLYVYTNVSPTGATLDEYVWIRNGANPFEQIENDMYRAIVQSNIDKLKADGVKAVNFIDYMPYLKSFGYEEIEITYLNEELTEFSFELSGMQSGGAILEVRIQDNAIVIPEINDCKEVTDFNSSAEQLSGNGVITEEDYANHLVDGYYLADGTFAYSESKTQSWEHYMGGVLIASYDYDTDTYTDCVNGLVTDNYYGNTEADNETDIVYAGEGGYATSDFSMYADIVTLDNTFSEIVSADWYGSVQEGWAFEGWLGNCKDEEFSDRFDEVHSTFEVRYAVENFDKFDETTQICLVGIAEAFNFTIDGQTSFRDMLLASGLDNTRYLELASKYHLVANGGSIK